MEGRDIGTKVLPDATLKVFLTADAGERARRRYDESPAESARYEQVLSDLIKRDESDRAREASPLRMAEGAVEVDSTGMTIRQVVDRIIALLTKRLDGEG